MKKTTLFFTLLIFIIFASCNKDTSQKEDFDKYGWDKDKWEKEKDDEACFELVYPVTFTMPDGSAIMVNDEKDSAIGNWYKTNDSQKKPQLQYPVDIIYEDDGTVETVTISNEDEMINAKKECDEDDWKKENCFDLVLPVTFTMPDGASISGNNEDELWSAIKDWYEAHPDVEEKPELQYPVDIIFEDETTQTINNEDEMIVAKKDCED